MARILSLLPVQPPICTVNKSVSGEYPENYFHPCLFSGQASCREEAENPSPNGDAYSGAVYAAYRDRQSDSLFFVLHDTFSFLLYSVVINILRGHISASAGGQCDGLSSCSFCNILFHSFHYGNRRLYVASAPMRF